MRALVAGDRHAAHRSHHGGEISRLRRCGHCVRLEDLAAALPSLALRIAARGGEGEGESESDEILWAETEDGSESDCPVRPKSAASGED